LHNITPHPHPKLLQLLFCIISPPYHPQLLFCIIYASTHLSIIYHPTFN